MPCLVDTHIHLDAPELEGKGFDFLSSGETNNLAAFILPGVRVKSWHQLADLAAQHPGVYAAPGLHPSYAEQWTRQAAEQLEQLCQAKKVVAVGEVGLDGVSGPEMELQEQVFDAQLSIALNAQLPVLLHVRKATGRVLEMLREQSIGQQLGGIWHGFSGSVQVAKELVQLGFKIGVGPILLRDSARKLPQVVKELSLDSLVLETDFPDMAETPGVLFSVAERVAELRQEPYSEIARVTTRTASKIFNIEVE